MLQFLMVAKPQGGLEQKKSMRGTWGQVLLDVWQQDYLPIENVLALGSCGLSITPGGHDHCPAYRN